MGDTLGFRKSAYALWIIGRGSKTETQAKSKEEVANAWSTAGMETSVRWRYFANVGVHTSTFRLTADKIERNKPRSYGAWIVPVCDTIPFERFQGASRRGGHFTSQSRCTVVGSLQKFVLTHGWRLVISRNSRNHGISMNIILPYTSHPSYPYHIWGLKQ
jgi:hypothetical protein